MTQDTTMNRPLRVGLIKATNSLDVQWHKPLAFGYLASYATYHGTVPLEVTHLDSLDRIEDLDVLGISCTSQDYAAAIEIAKNAKTRIPSLITVLGGHHITHLPQTLGKCFDIGVVGEGEVTFTEMLEALYRSNLVINAADLTRVKGIVYWENGRLSKTENRSMIDPLDTIPHPFRSPDDTPYIFTSRGCPYKCAFCSSSAFWDKTRFFSAEYVVEEIEEVIRNYPGTRHIAIWDDLFAADKQRFHSIIDGLERKQLTNNIQYSFTCRANLINDELCRALKRLNVPATAFGAESGSNRILKLMNKGCTVEMNQQALDCLHNNGIPAACSFIVGWPSETEEEVRQTFEFILKNLYDGKLEVGYPVNILMPIPGTPIWDQAVLSGLINLEDFDWKRLAAFAAFRDSNASSLTDWIKLRRANNSLYLAEETLPQELLYEIMIEYQMLFDSYHNLSASLKGLPPPPPSVATQSMEVEWHNSTEADYTPPTEGYYTHARPEIVAEVPPHAISILDVGCATGQLGAYLKKAIPSRSVVGIELNKEICIEAGKALDAVYCVDVESFDPPFSSAQFDCVIFADILEHLVDPWGVTRKYLSYLKPGGTLIVSLPNIRNIEIISRLLHDGEWEYQDEGILDRTHLRFFTRRQFLHFLTESGVECNRIIYLGDDRVDFSQTADSLTFGDITIGNLQPEEAWELFATQVVYTGVYKPGTSVTESPETRSLFKLATKLSFSGGICFGSDFHDEYNNSRWVGPRGKLLVASTHLNQQLALSFDLSSYKLELLHQAPLTVTIYINDVPVDTLNFTRNDERKTVKVVLHPADNNACIRIESDTFFVPSETEGSSDSRQLSVLFSNLKMIPLS